MAERPAPRRLVAGNWKMNHRGALIELSRVKERVLRQPAACALAVCPPATLIAEAAAIVKGAPISIGGQDCHPEPYGPFTGDISAEMLKDAGAALVILGHSERRHGHGETSELICRKVHAARRAGLIAILCVGETEAERDRKRTLAVVGDQLRASLPGDIAPAALVIAYEPVWAIGTGRTPSDEDIEEVHGFIRSALGERLGEAAASVPILYGGSVKPANARSILGLRNVDGALVGGASLSAREFLPIIDAA